MTEALKSLLKKAGAKPASKKFVREYREKMETEVIPNIVKDVRERQRLAAEARYGVPAPSEQN